MGGEITILIVELTLVTRGQSSMDILMLRTMSSSKYVFASRCHIYICTCKRWPLFPLLACIIVTLLKMVGIQCSYDYLDLTTTAGQLLPTGSHRPTTIILLFLSAMVFTFIDIFIGALFIDHLSNLYHPHFLDIFHCYRFTYGFRLPC